MEIGLAGIGFVKLNGNDLDFSPKEPAYSCKISAYSRWWRKLGFSELNGI
tara:strand:- start:22 stop:171 length:150 start_codon:yes stop_codon:yes gene_type:complete